MVFPAKVFRKLGCQSFVVMGQLPSSSCLPLAMDCGAEEGFPGGD